MAQLGHFEVTVINAVGNAQSGVSVQIYREGATVNGGQSGTSPLTVTVRHPGKIKASDTVFIGTTTGTTYNVDSITDTTVVLSGFAGTLTLTNGNRIVPANLQPTLYSDDQGGTTTTNPLTTSSTGYADAYVEFGAYDYIHSSILWQTQIVPTEAPGQVRYADSFARNTSTLGIQEALNDLPSTGGVVIGPGTSGTITAAVTLAAGQTLLWHSKAVTVTKGFNGAAFTLNGQRARLIGARIDGDKGSFTGVGVAVTSAADSEVSDCEITNCSTIGIDIDTSSKVLVEGNRVSGCNGGGIFWENNSDDVICRNNWVSSLTGSSDADCIACHGTTSSQSVNRPIIEGNSLIVGVSGSFGIEVGAFSGATVVGPIVRGNTILGSTATHAGGISFGDTTTGGCIEGNYYNVGGQTGSIAGIELILCNDVVVKGNVVEGGTTLVSGISLGRSANCVVSGNVVNGWNSAGAGAAIYCGSSTASTDASDNIIGDNRVIMTGAGNGKGIWLQANAASVTLNRTQIHDNLMTGNAAATAYGIHVDLTTGTLDETKITDNRIRNFGTGIITGAVAIDELTITENDLRGNTTALTISATGTIRQWNNITTNDQPGPSLGPMTDIASATTITITGPGFYRFTGSTSITTINTGVGSTWFIATGPATGSLTVAQTGNISFQQAGAQTFDVDTACFFIYNATAAKWLGIMST